jgi:PPOX class probable FMN-dependent enzyme
MSDPWRIETEEQIGEVLGQPFELVRQKIFDHVDEYAAAFIARSPLALLATSDKRGALDVSPKGDAPGFVTVEDSRTLLLPDRPGNKLAYGFRNIVENPRVGMVFVVPGTTETLRANGSAELTRDPALLERFAVQGKPALLVTRITVEECFFHCGKAFIRSGLWKPDSWPAGYRVNLGKQLAAKMGGGTEVAEQIEEGLITSYTERLY